MVNPVGSACISCGTIAITQHGNVPLKYVRNMKENTNMNTFPLYMLLFFATTMPTADDWRSLLLMDIGERAKYTAAKEVCEKLDIHSEVKKQFNLVCDESIKKWI